MVRLALVFNNLRLLAFELGSGDEEWWHLLFLARATRPQAFCYRSGSRKGSGRFKQHNLSYNNHFVVEIFTWGFVKGRPQIYFIGTQTKKLRLLLTVSLLLIQKYGGRPVRSGTAKSRTRPERIQKFSASVQRDGASFEIAKCLCFGVPAILCCWICAN